MFYCNDANSYNEQLATSQSDVAQNEVCQRIGSSEISEANVLDVRVVVDTVTGTLQITITILYNVLFKKLDLILNQRFGR